MQGEGNHFDTDVLVVGTGPMGATTALALATYGVRVHAVNKRSWLADTPRAHITNLRAVEVLRALGVEAEVRRQATPWDYMGDTLFTTSLAGPEIARLRTWGTGDERFGDYLKSSPCTMLDVPQHVMEPILVNEAAHRGALFSFSTEYLGHEQDAGGVTVRLKNRISGETYTQRARYLVGADGGRSQVAEDIGLELKGQAARAGTVYAQFNADLSAYVAHRPSILYWMMNPSANFGEIGMGLLRAITPWTHWISGWGFDLSCGEPDLSVENALVQIRSLIGIPDFECEITHVSPWYVNQQYAPVYSSGRVLCGGDAVHRHPPSSGLGSNTCMQDAFNLAWKLAFAVKGWAGQGLVDSYSDERAPVGQQIVQRANQSRVDYAPLREAVFVANAPDPVAATLERTFAPTPEGAEARKKLADALALKNTEFNAQGIEMNQRYVSRAVIEEPGAMPEVFEEDPVLYLQATTRPGAKLPHAWMVNRQGKRVSTLDLVHGDALTLITGLSGGIWREAAEGLGLPFLKVLVLGDEDSRDLYCNWQRIRQMPESGALIVRPDAVVAWRETAVPDSVEEAQVRLHAVLSALLG